MEGLHRPTRAAIGYTNFRGFGGLPPSFIYQYRNPVWTSVSLSFLHQIEPRPTCRISPGAALDSGVFKRGLVGVNPPWPDRRTGVHCNLQPLHKLAAYVDWTQLLTISLSWRHIRSCIDVNKPTCCFSVYVVKSCFILRWPVDWVARQQRDYVSQFYHLQDVIYLSRIRFSFGRPKVPFCM